MLRSKSRKFFVKTADGHWIPQRSDKPYVNPGDRRLVDIIGVESGGPGGRRLNEDGHSENDYRKFLNLLLRMLNYDPKCRCKPFDALRHGFFNKPGDQSQTQNANASRQQFQPISNQPPITVASTSVGINVPYQNPSINSAPSHPDKFHSIVQSSNRLNPINPPGLTSQIPTIPTSYEVNSHHYDMRVPMQSSSNIAHGDYYSQRGPVMTRSRTRSLAPNVTEAERATTEGKILHPSHPGIHHPSLGLPP